MGQPEYISLSSVKKIIVGGERVPLHLLKQLQRIDGLQIYSAYGPTEATIWCTVGNITDSTYIHAGYPLKNCRLRISEEGELYISGTCLFSGYYLSEEKTKLKMRVIDGVQYYCTGDFVKLTENGQYIIHGRRDNQIKINGHRVELEEIENN